MIEVKNISKKFLRNIDKKEKIEFLADDNISFTAKEGEILGILGPNGAGKTTLLRMIAGIMKPSSGSITIGNLNYKNNEIDIKKEIAYLSGNTKLYKDISPYELLKMCGEYYNIPQSKLEKEIKEVSSMFDLESFLYSKIGNLSTGQCQRVGLSRCAIHNPKYYILDEPTSGLDIILSQVILNFIKKQKEMGKCILYSTHYMEEAENICDRVLMIHEGKIIKIGTPEEIERETNTNNLRDAFFKLIGGVSNE